MISIVYPATLPGPSVSMVTPAERRLLSDLTGGPQQARGLQRDYLATQQVEWAVLNANEAATFNIWWHDTLTGGGAWFASTWPAPQGWTSLVRRFIGAPRWTHLPGGFWRVSALVQVRGRGLAPQTPSQTIYQLPHPGVAYPGGTGDSTFKIVWASPDVPGAATATDPAYQWTVRAWTGVHYQTALDAVLAYADFYFSSFTHSPNGPTDQRALRGATVTMSVINGNEVDALFEVSRYYGYAGDSGGTGFFYTSATIQIDRGLV